jgi:hypothetical protein
VGEWNARNRAQPDAAEDERNQPQRQRECDHPARQPQSPPTASAGVFEHGRARHRRGAAAQVGDANALVSDPCHHVLKRT